MHFQLTAATAWVVTKVMEHGNCRGDGGAFGWVTPVYLWELPWATFINTSDMLNDFLYVISFAVPFPPTL